MAEGRAFGALGGKAAGRDPWNVFEMGEAKRTGGAVKKVHIFHEAAKDLRVINAVADNAIPDVKTGAACAAEIYDFYRAGILTGSDVKGTFRPSDSIKRSEVAAILIRMFDSSARRTITLE